MTDRRRHQRCGNSGSYPGVMEPEYDVVDDQEEALNVRIFPSWPINDDREYADRDLPRSPSAQSLSSFSSGNSGVLLRNTSGPAINRDMKPGRKKARLDKKPPAVQPAVQHTHRHPPPPQAFASELESHLCRLTMQELSRRDGRRTTKRADFSEHTEGLQKPKSASALNYNPRHSLDLESHDIETRSQKSLERVPSKRLHHEWPQTKEDQHDFAAMEKPQQIHCEDWYIGACNRADAEHALHLVNKDGAFLVRDCSINTNSEPFVLTVFHEKKVYNVKIRFTESTRKYALGTRQRSNDMFNSVAEIIKFHSIFPLILISGRNVPGSKYPENCILTCPVTKRDVDQLLR